MIGDILAPYCATITTAPGCTADQIIHARSDWAAWWLARTLYADSLVLVRPASRPCDSL